MEKRADFMRDWKSNCPILGHMLVLGMDTSGVCGSVAVVRDGEVLGVVSSASEEAYSSRIFRQLEFLLAEVKVGLGEVDVFAVSAGPGSFTGLRVGLAAVKGWAEVYGKPIVGVSALEAVAVQGAPFLRPGEAGVTGGEFVAGIMDGRRGQIFGALYSRDGAGLREVVGACVLDAREFLELVKEKVGGRGVVFATPWPRLIEAELAAAGVVAELTRVSPVLAASIALIGEERAGRGLVTSSLELDANYIRRSDAEVLWKA